MSQSTQSTPRESEGFLRLLRKHGALIALIAIWIAIHVRPVLGIEFLSQWEILQARKLLEYGFLERAGAILEPGFDKGHLAYPGDINYTHHPHLMVWFYTLLYSIGGGWACYAFLLGLRFAATIVLFHLLRSWFSTRAAFCATVAFALAPAALAMDMETNIIGVAASLWPFAAWMANRVRLTGRGIVGLGVFVFFAGQTSWMFLTLMAALIWLAYPQKNTWRDLAKRPLAAASTRSVLLGGGLSLAFFLLQLAFYTRDWDSVIHYLLGQMGVAKLTTVDATPKSKMLALVAARTVFFAGPALAIGAFVGTFSKRFENSRRAVEASLVFLAGYACVILLLYRFCFIEVSPYLYLLAPATILTAAGLHRWKSVSYLAFLMSLAALVFAYFTVRDVGTKRAAAVAPLVKTLTENTKNVDVVFTNLRTYQPPFPAWDTISPSLVAADADRMFFYNIDSAQELEVYRSRLKRNYRNLVFLYSPELPMAPDFLDWIQKNGKEYHSETLSITPEAENLAAKMRMAIWRMTGRFVDRAVSGDKNPKAYSLEFFRLPEPREASVNRTQ